MEDTDRKVHVDALPQAIELLAAAAGTVNSVRASGCAEVEVVESEADGVEPASGREALWYPVGVALALLAASGAFMLCFSGRWIG